MTIEEYRNTVARRVYENMQMGIYPDSCMRCNQVGRTRYDLYNKDLYTGDVGKNWEDLHVKHLDLRFGNLCNSACITCKWRESDYFYTIHDKGYWLNKDQSLPQAKREQAQSKMEWFNDPAVIKQIIDKLEYITHIYATGGEPTINPMLHKIMQRLIDMGRASEVTMEINTNCTNSNTKFLNLLDPFKKRLMLSIDAYGELNDAVRHPTQWKKVEECIKTFKSMCTGKDNIVMTPCLNLSNFYKFHELVEYSLECGAPVGQNLNVLIQPSWLCIGRTLTPDRIEEVISNWDSRVLKDSLIKKLKNKSVYAATERSRLDQFDISISHLQKWFTSRGFDPALTGIPELQ
jgi:MoaA/NifB/PqqE/SkfB family radical SAM enzyme